MKYTWAQNLRQGIVMKTSFGTRVSRMGLGSFVDINTFLWNNILFSFYIFSIYFEYLKLKSTQMLRPQNGNSEVSFNDTILNFRLCSMETVQQNGRFTLFSSKFLSLYIFYSLWLLPKVGCFCLIALSNTWSKYLLWIFSDLPSFDSEYDSPT